MCLHASSVETLADSAFGLAIELKSNGTHPFIIDALVMPVHNRGQTSFHDNLPPKMSNTLGLLYCLICNAASEQDQIGFYPIFDGHISSKWTVAQDCAYWEQLHFQKQGTLCEKLTIMSLYWMTRIMWKHQNNVLFNNQAAKVSCKQRKAIFRAVKTQLKIGFWYV